MSRTLTALLALAAFMGACNSKQVVEDAQCSDEEQGLFMACLSSGCSATYDQDLSGTDACAVEGGGSVVSVEAGGECGFTSSGSCYVVCDCPEGVGVEFDVDDEPEVTTSADFEGDTAGECADGADNDRDGLYDCNDPDCLNSPDCQEDPIPSDTGDLVEDTGAEVEPDPDTGSPPDEVVTDADGDGYAVEDGDCDDRNPAINPAASDIVGDTRDQNCDGIDGTDMDGDGFASEASGGDDCNDFDVVINPDFGIRDVTDYVDSNCDGEDGLSYDYKALFLENMQPVTLSSGDPTPEMDFDGDGLKDLILCEGSGTGCGGRSTYYIVFGSTIGTAPTDRLTVSDVDATIALVGSGYFYGEFQTKDIDGDGLDDLAFNWDGQGFIYYGSSILGTPILTPGYNEDVRIYGTVSGDSGGGGGTVFLVDDVTGDGAADISVSGGWPTRLLTASEIGSGFNVDTNTLGVGVMTSGGGSGVGLVLGGFDPDGDGKPDFLTSCYITSTRTQTGYKDLDSPGASVPCNGYLGSFTPTMVLDDIDGDGEKELSDGYCIQNISTFASGGSCDYRTSDLHYGWSFPDVDGDGTADTVEYGYVSGRYQTAVTFDVFGGAADQVVTPEYVYLGASGDFDGDGIVDLSVYYSGGTAIVGVR